METNASKKNENEEKGLLDLPEELITAILVSWGTTSYYLKHLRIQERIREEAQERQLRQQQPPPVQRLILPSLDAGT